jgi:hypothetical protein
MKGEGSYAVIIFVVTVLAVLLVMFAWSKAEDKRQHEVEQDKMVREAYGSYAVLAAGLTKFTQELKGAAEAFAAMQTKLSNRLDLIESKQSVAPVQMVVANRTVGSCYGVLRQNSTDLDLSCVLNEPVVVGKSAIN